MNKFNLNEKYEKVLKSRGTLLVSCIALFILTVTLVFLEVGPPILQKIAEKFMVVFAVFLIFELFMRRQLETEVAITIGKAINADVQFLKEKMKGEVDSIIKSCLEAKLCDENMANIFYKGLILPYIDQENFRDKFEYEVWLRNMKEDEEKTIHGVTFSQENYFQIEERLSCMKRLNLKKGQKLSVALCLEDSELKHYLGDKSCIYKAIIRIGDEDQKSKLINILEKTPEKINELFDIKIKLNKSEVIQEKVLPYTKEKGIEIICKYTGNNQKDADISIVFNTIRDKKINYYTSYIFDPTFAPLVRFNYHAEEISNVFPVINYTTKMYEVGGKDSLRTSWVKVSNEWVFPTSGVIFIWGSHK